MTSLRYLADVRVSNVDKKAVEGEEMVRLCNYTDVYYQDRITSDLDFMQASASASQIRNFGLRAGDTIITKDSETADDIGVPAFVPTDLPGVVCGYHLALIRPRAGMVDPRFLGWVIQSDYARGQLEVNASGVTRYGLTYGAIQSVEIPDNKTVDEQRRIADFLDDQVARINAAVAHRGRQAARVAEYPSSWASERLADMRLVAPSPRLGRTVRVRSGDGLGLATLDGAGEFTVVGGNGAVGLHTSSNAEPGAIAIGRVGAHCGNVHLLAEPAWITDNALIVVPSASWLPEFLAFALEGMRLNDLADRTAQPLLTGGKVKDLELPMPELSTQDAAATEWRELVQRADTLLAALHISVDLLEERKRSLITAAVTGELDVSSGSLRAAEAVVGG